MAKTIKSSSLVRFLILSLLIRLLLMPFSAYPEDIFETHLSSLKILTNINHFLSIGFSPISHLIDAFFLFLFKPILPLNLLPQLVKGPFYVENINRVVFFFKIPYLLAEYLFYYLLNKLFVKLKVTKENKVKLFIFLFFNPVILYGVYIFGRFESYSMLATAVIGLLLLNTSLKGYVRITLVGLAVCLASLTREFYLMLAFVIIFLKERLIYKLTALVIALGGYFLFLNLNPNKKTIVDSYGQTEGIFAIRFLLLTDSKFYLFFIVLGILLFFSYFKINFTKKTNLFIFNWFSFLILTTLFSTSHYHPQYFVWILPFLVINLAYINEADIFNKILTVSWIISFLFLLVPLHGAVTSFGVFFPLASTFRYITLENYINIDYPRISDAGKSFIAGSLLALAVYLINYFSSHEKNKLRS